MILILLIFISILVYQAQCSLIEEEYLRLSDKIPVTELFAFFGVVFDELLKKHIHNLLMCDNKIVIIGGWVIGYMPYALRIIYRLCMSNTHSIGKIWEDHYINNSKNLKWIGNKESNSKGEGIILMFLENIKHSFRKNIVGKRPGKVYVYKYIEDKEKDIQIEDYIISFITLFLEFLFLILIIYYSVKEKSYIGLIIILSGYVTTINFNYCLILCGPSNKIILPEINKKDEKEKVIYLEDNDDSSISLFIGEEEILEGSVIRKPDFKGNDKTFIYIYTIFSSLLVIIQMMMSIILADDISYITGILILINIFISLFCNSYRANKWNRNYITRKIYVKEDNSKYLNIIVFNTKSWAENIYISCYINEIVCWDFLLSKLPNEKSVRCKKLLIKYIMNNNINDSEEWWILSMKNAVENLKENLNEKEFNKIKIRIKEYKNNECTCNNCNINILI